MLLEDVVEKRGQGVETAMWGTTRPHVKEFLIFCFSYFKIVAVWSAGQKKYVDAIVDYLFRDIRRPHVVFSYDDCAKTSDNLLTKPLQHMIDTVAGLKKYMSLQNTFALDDRPTTYEDVNPDNGILIPVYKPKNTLEELQQDDDTLIKLMNWFTQPEVIHSSDIRTLDKTHIF